MPGESKTVIVTGASQGIGAAVVSAFLERGYKVVANSRSITRTGPFPPSDKLALVDGDIGAAATAAEDRRDRRRSIRIDRRPRQQRGHLLHEGVHRLHGGGLPVARLDEPGRLSLRHPARDQADAGPEVRGQHRDDHGLAGDNPIAGIHAAVPMMTKGGLNAVTRSLAMEYAKDGIRVNAVAARRRRHPAPQEQPAGFLEDFVAHGPGRRPYSDIADAVLYLTEASQVTGEVLHVDGGAHFGKW